MSTYFTPISITINVDSFEHLEFETRPDQLLVYTLVQGDERVVIEFVPGRAGRGRGAVRRPASSSSTPAGSSRWSSSAWRGPRSRAAGEHGAAGRSRGPAREQGTTREDRQTRMSAASEAASPPPAGRSRSYFKFAERGTSLGTETRAGLTTFMVMAYIIFVNPSILMAGFKDATRPSPAASRPPHRADRRDHDDRDGRGRELPVRARRGPRHQRHRGVHADRQGPRRRPARWASSCSRASWSPSSSSSASGRRS